MWDKKSDIWFGVQQCFRTVSHGRCCSGVRCGWKTSPARWNSSRPPLGCRSLSGSAGSELDWWQTNKHLLYVSVLISSHVFSHKLCVFTSCACSWGSARVQSHFSRRDRTERHRRIYTIWKKHTVRMDTSTYLYKEVTEVCSRYKENKIHMQVFRCLFWTFMQINKY